MQLFSVCAAHCNPPGAFKNTNASESILEIVSVYHSWVGTWPFQFPGVSNMLPGPTIPVVEERGWGWTMAPPLSTPLPGPLALRGEKSEAAWGRDMEGRRAPELQAFPQPLKFIVATDSD